MREKTIVVSRVGAAIVAMFSWAQKQGASAGLFGSVGAATFTGQMLSGLEADVVMNTIFIEGNGAA
jgi:hypothetical protein